MKTVRKMITRAEFRTSAKALFSSLDRVNHDLSPMLLFAAGERQTAYCVHLVLAALWFSPFLLFGRILAANTDLLTHNYPMLLLAKRNFLQGVVGLWNPYTFSGAPESVAAGTPIMSPENWPLFLVPERFFFPALTFFAFLKLWLLGIVAYRFYCAELLNRRWALFASIVYQLSGWAIWAVTSYVSLSIFLYYTILLALIWTIPRRNGLQNYLLLSIVTTLMLMAGNISHASYALLGAGILFLYRIFSQRALRPMFHPITIFAASCATALLIFCARLLPIVASLRSGVRLSNCCQPTFVNASFFIARFFDTEIFAVNYRDSQTIFANISSHFKGYHLHGSMPSFFGVIAGLLVLWAFLSEKSAKAAFWSIYAAVALGLAIFIQPFDALAAVLLTPVYHSLSLHILLPAGFAAAAALGGMAIERTMRRGRVSRLTIELFGFAVTVIALFILMVPIRFVTVIGSGLARLVLASLLLVSVLAILVWRAYPRVFRVITLPILSTIAAISLVSIVFVRSNNLTFVSHVKNIGSELLIFTGVVMVLVLLLRDRIHQAWRLGLWGGAGVLMLCLSVNLYPWTFALQEDLSPVQNLVLGALGGLRFALGVVSIFLVIATIRAGRLAARSAYLLFLLLLLAEQVPAGKVHSHINTNPFYAADTPYPAIAEPLDVEGKPVGLDLANYRVNFPNTMLRLPFYKEIWGPSNEICASVNVAYGIRSYGGFNNTIPLRTSKFLENWSPGEEPRDVCIYANVTDDRYLDLSGVGYEYNRATRTVTRRAAALSRMMTFTRFEIIPNDEAVLRRLKASDFDPLNEVILQSDPAFQSRSSSMNGSVLGFSEINPDRIELDVRTDGPALLLFNDSFNPEWVATIDGVQQKIMAANYNFMAVSVPTGQSHVVLEYKPQSFYIGSICAAFGVTILAAAFGVQLVFRRRGTQPQIARPVIPVRDPVVKRITGILIAIALLQILLAPLKASRTAGRVDNSRIGKISSTIPSNPDSPIENLIDDRIDDSWEAKLSGDMPVEINLRYPGEGLRISSYAFYVGKAGKDSTDRMPKRWEFQASHDQRTWVKLDQENVADAWIDGETREYKIGRPDTYPYYRFVIRELWDSSIIRMNEIIFK